MSRSIPVRFTLAQLQHLRTLVKRNREDGRHWGERTEWERRTTWLEAKLRDTEFRLRNRINPPGGTQDDEAEE